MRRTFMALAGSAAILSATAAFGQGATGQGGSFVAQPAAAPAQGGSSAGWNMPWQLVPASPASAATGDAAAAVAGNTSMAKLQSAQPKFVRNTYQGLDI